MFYRYFYQRSRVKSKIKYRQFYHCAKLNKKYVYLYHSLISWKMCSHIFVYTYTNTILYHFISSDNLPVLNNAWVSSFPPKNWPRTHTEGTVLCPVIWASILWMASPLDMLFNSITFVSAFGNCWLKNCFVEVQYGQYVLE